jgi:Flp pilus assembly protein TadG
MFKNTRKQRRFRSEEGQSLVEVAMLMPLLVLIVAGTLDLGRAYMTMVALNDAAAEGATYASMHPSATSEIVARTADSSGGVLALDPDLVTVDYDTPVAPGKPITVTIGYNYQLMTPVLNAIVPEGAIILSASEVRSIIQ